MARWRGDGAAALNRPATLALCRATFVAYFGPFFGRGASSAVKLVTCKVEVALRLAGR